MSALPRTSPWGDVQRCEKLTDGVFLVSTASHGGIMVRKNAADFLSPEARKIALNERNYLSFEEDCEEAIAMRELLDKKMWALPDRINDKAGYEASINRSLIKDQPEYWEARQKRLAEQTVPAEVDLQTSNVRRDIIFRGSDYKEMFRIKDGDSIKITVAYDGEELIRKCRWLDEAHMDVGHTCYHMDEFMEKQTRVGNKYEPIPGKEPKLDIVVAEPGCAPYYAEIPMSNIALRNLLGGEPEIIFKDKSVANLMGVNGNGTIVAFGVRGDYLTSLHPYIAQSEKLAFAERASASGSRLSLSDRLDAGKIKAAEHNAAQDKSALKPRHTEVGD